MAQKAYASSQLHQAFYDYLINKFDGDTMEAQRSMETAERIIPVPVPGEYKMEEEKQTPAILADSHLLPKTQTTIFTEGEDDGTITKEQRRQNMMLREACLESFCFSGYQPEKQKDCSTSCRWYNGSMLPLYHRHYPEGGEFNLQMQSNSNLLILN